MKRTAMKRTANLRPKRDWSHLKPKACKACGTEFQPVNAFQKYCCAGCRLKAELPDRACHTCGKVFQPKRNSPGRYCSHSCAGRGRNRLGPPWSLRSKGEEGCRNCGRFANHLHHIVPRSKSVKGKRDLRNGIPLCSECHRGWHDRVIAIPVWRLKPDELALAVELADPVWVERNYPVLSLPEEVRLVEDSGGIEAAWQTMVCWLGPEYAEVVRERRPQGETVVAYLDRRRTAPLAYRLEAAC